MTTPAPAVSVLMPAYNRAEYVGAAIASVLGQSFTDLELIVIDDGSTDGTAAEIVRVTDPRLRYLARPHGGISAAMNAGLRIAQGRYLARLGSDDLWLPEFLSVQVAQLERRPEIGLVYARAEGMDARGEPLGQTWGMPLRHPGEPLRSMLYGDCTCDITILVRRACVERAGPYDESLITSVDWDMWLRVAQHTAFAFTDQVLARFRRHPGNITGAASAVFARSFESRRRVLDKTFADPGLPAAALAMKTVAYRNLAVDEGLRWLEAGHRDRALAAFARALVAGGNPLPTLGRVGWFACIRPALLRHERGRALDGWQAGVRQRLRERFMRSTPR
jgi:glycosyltransferase involved in cell wall biosynthesis